MDRKQVRYRKKVAGKGGTKIGYRKRYQGKVERKGGGERLCKKVRNNNNKVRGKPSEEESQKALGADLAGLRKPVTGFPRQRSGPTLC